MVTFTAIKDLQAHLESIRKKNQSIGFVPTMGALHEGHIALVKRCLTEHNACVVSIFVNPTQFNNPEDLEKYPRTPARDARMLEEAGCHALFMPPVEEMYPFLRQAQNPGQALPADQDPDIEKEKWKKVNLGMLDKVMEGAHRPGHFKGVIQVVSKLFDIVKPDRAYFGQKDYQQLAVIREMARQLRYPVEIVACPTVREPDGLAMSSRNVRLKPRERAVAPKIAQVLFKVKELAKSAHDISELKKFAVEELNKEKLFTLEYFEIADARSLLPAKDLSVPAVACVALKLGAVRLIDNVLL